MHLLLTDRLLCPRCGPPFGLVLIADEIRNRRVITGELGCANCRERFPIRGGFGDLRAPPRDPLPAPPAEGEWTADREEALRLAALMGVTEGPGTLLIAGPAARQAKAVSELVGGVEVVGVDPRLAGQAESEGVSRLAAGGSLPFRPQSFRALVLSGERTEIDLPGRRGPSGSHRRDLAEDPAGPAPAGLAAAVGLVSLKGRVVVLGAPPDAGLAFQSLGLRVLLEEEGVVVAERATPEASPLVTLRGP